MAEIGRGGPASSISPYKVRTNRLSQSPSNKVLRWALFHETESEILADLGSFKVHEFTVLISILSSIWFKLIEEAKIIL